MKQTVLLTQGSPVLDPAALWPAYVADRDSAVRERIVRCYLQFARMLAAKMYAGRSNSDIEFADYLQYARVGLLEAIDRFDPDRGVKFETFAGSRINGAMLNGLASFTEIQEQIAARKRTVAERMQSLGDAAPGRDKPEALFGYLAQLALGLAVGFVLEDTGSEQYSEPQYLDNTYTSVELKQLRARMKDMLATLPDNQKKVITYHYLQQIQFEEIARMLDLSKGRIAQLHREALGTLKMTINRSGTLHWST